MSFRHGDFSTSYENDGTPFQKIGLGDGGDSYRTAAVGINIGSFGLKMNLFTGKRSYNGDPKKNNERGKSVDNWSDRPMYDEYGIKHKYGCNSITGNYVNEVGSRYRLGALALTYKNWGIGINSERVRHAFQSVFAHRWVSPQGTFQNTSWSVNPYFQYQTRNSFTLW